MIDAPSFVSDVSLTILLGNDPNQNPLEFRNSVNQKVIFSLGVVPIQADKKRVNITDRDQCLGLEKSFTLLTRL